MADPAASAAQVRTRQGLAEVVRVLGEARAALHGDPSPETVQQVLEHLDAARDLLRRVAHPAGRPAPVEDGPVLEHRLALQPGPTGARAARASCRSVCERWGVPEAVRSAAVDVASELVTNGLRATSTAVVLTLELTPHQLVVRVWDDGPGSPQLLPYRPGVSQHGLGLRLVQRLSEDWGWEPAGGGKTVWARLLLHTADDAPG